MIAVDTNILVYAHKTGSPFHVAAARCVIGLAEGTGAWAVPWPCVHEFLSVVTNPRIHAPATSIEDALDFIARLRESPTLVLLSETEAHWNILSALVVAGRTRGGRVHDARIAALCIEHGVRELWTADRDYGRFRALTVVNPLIG